MKTDEADAIVEMDKAIGEPIVWNPVESGRHQRFRFKVRVIAKGFPGHLHLTGYASENGSWSFVLLGPGDLVLRRISAPLDGHWDPQQRTYADPRHKHRWTEQFEDRCVYIPDDIRWDNFNHALVDFVKECRITLLHEPPELLFKGRIAS